MMKNRILYVEDDETLAFLTKDNLSEKYEVLHFTDGNEALNKFRSSKIDLCILDIMLPSMDGFSLAKSIRALNSNVPILFLSAKTLKEDRIRGLQLGADDYLVKPFSIEELILKIEIFLRRSGKVENKDQYNLGSMTFEPANFQLIGPGKCISLTKRESDILFYLIRQKNEIVKRDDILLELWGDNDYFMGRSLDVFISRLRKYLSKEKDVKIENFHGVGFRLVAKEKSIPENDF